MRGARAVHIRKQKDALWLESAPGDSPKPVYGREMGPTRLISAVFLLLLKPPSPDNGYRE
jgi:hypothetical protein